MGKSTPKAPAAPDPVATANAQAAANTQAAVTQAGLNRIDQVTPEGSIKYSIIGQNADGTPKYQQTQTYSPGQQALYDSQNQIAQALNGLAGNNVSRVADAQSKPFSFDGMTPMQTGAYGGGVQSTFGTGGPLQSNVAAGNIQDNIAGAGSVQNSIADAGPVQRGVDYGQPFNPGDFNASAQQASDSAYAAAAARLDPQFAQQENDFKSRLANSGISENSDAYRREMDNFGRTRNDAYGQARNVAFSQGLAAQQQGYGQALGTRQQNTGETTTAGQFANSAQGQIFGQNAQQLGAFNTAQGQQFDQNAQQYAAYNGAQDQRFSQGQANAGLNNSAQGQQYAQNQGAAEFGNTAQNQMFNQSAANVALNNNARQAQITEASYLRNLPLNDIATLMGTGGGVQTPQFQNVSQVGVAAPDYQGAVYKNYDAANQQYQTKLQQQSSGLGSIFGLAGTLGAGAMKAGMFSDSRLKENVRRIGTLANGLATYVFNYIGNSATQFGVMAQEALGIVPEAVSVRDGYYFVDYSKVW